MITHALYGLFAKSVGECSGGSFFGLRSWFYYLGDQNGDRFDDGCNLRYFTLLPDGTNRSDIPLVLLAIVDDLLRIAAFVAIAYVIVGAFQYVVSQGSPDKTSQAQATIINALIGLAIALISVAFVTFVGTKFR